MISKLKYFSEVRSELSKVIWPKPTEVIKLTIIIFVITAVVGAYVGGLDFAMTKLLGIILAN